MLRCTGALNLESVCTASYSLAPGPDEVKVFRLRVVQGLEFQSLESLNTQRALCTDAVECRVSILRITIMT